MDLTPEQIAGLDQQMTDFERTAADPAGIYARNPDAAAQTRAQLQAIRIRAGLAPAVAPPSPQQIAADMHAQAFSLPDTVNENLQSMLDEARLPLEALAKDKVALSDAVKQIKEELGGAPEYDKLLRNARLYKSELTAAETIDLRTLQTYASQGVRNSVKRTGKVG
jgi:hypothetical protein